MISVDNRNVLRTKAGELLSRMTELEDSNLPQNITVENARTGVPTLKITVDGKTQYIHSKYDPEKEAKRLIEQYKVEAKHVLFIGAGLGYHIKAFTDAYPNTKFSIYEPDEEVLLTYFTYAELRELPLQNLVRIFTGLDEESITMELQAILQSANAMLQVIILPVYEKIYEKQIIHITECMVEVLKRKRLNLGTTKLHQKNWTINSMKNFPTLLETSNVLYDVDRELFRGKPAIIVAAGPSLNEEYEHLRYIKENKLAYILSVGSAINSLIEQGIYPDATCSIDPQIDNYKVTKKVSDYSIETIPLIFGSTVGFKTVETYPGRKLHMITSPDTVSPQLLDTTKSINIVWDAPTVAAATFQLLSQLECNPIILVGQNLAYQDNKRYAAGIEYDFITNEVKEEEMNKAETVKDVYGNDIQTNISFNSMRRQLELYIQMNKNIEVINTTKGGAQIAGTSFVELQDLVENRLKSKVVDQGWTNASNSYDKDYTKKQLEKVSRAEEKCKELLKQALGKLEKIHEAKVNKQMKNMESRFAAFDKDFNRLKRNMYYRGFIEPMLSVQNERLSEESQYIRYESDVLKKAEIVVGSFSMFIQEVNAHIDFTEPYFVELKAKIEAM